MKKAATAVALAATAVMALATSSALRAWALDVAPQTIYGSDDRLDLYQVSDPMMRRLAGSTVALFSASNVKVDATGKKAELTTSNYGERRNLCPGERFRDQGAGAFCSGSLVAPDMIMTAGHCVTSADSCKNAKFVFGFAIKEAGQMPTSVSAEEVYGCAQLVAREQTSDGADFALVRLDRQVFNHQPLRINRGGEIAKGASVFVIGHPAGLPTKVAANAIVRDAGKNGYFVTNLDTFGGNSGSAVFNAQSGEIEGILVRGEADYEQRGSCSVAKVCPVDACRGEDVTKISVLAAMIPRPWREGGGMSGRFAFSSLSKLLDKNWQQ